MLDISIWGIKDGDEGVIYMEGQDDVENVRNLI